MAGVGLPQWRPGCCPFRGTLFSPVSRFRLPVPFPREICGL